MKILSRPKWWLKENEVTDKSLFLNRRDFIKASGLLTMGGALSAETLTPSIAEARGAPLAHTKSAYRVDEPLTKYEDVTTYNNFYEFGADKSDPAINARQFKTTPWSVAVEGEVAKPGVYRLEDLFKNMPLEERIYRFRCVEGWSMVVPWIGFPLSSLLKRFEPNSRAKYVEMTTLYDPKQMPGQKRSVLQWPYVEGLRIDEAMHPLTMLVVGLYGEVLPNQNGAPLRLIVPWKYGFKSVKSIVKIRLVEKQPATTWGLANSSEYGFYSNVNPDVDHPRWSQKRERRLGEFFKRDTLPFNGYANEVAAMYAKMDLRRYF